ncbi:CinY protein [Kitasatospora sp. NPDC088346]|uniref:CinY protein n=1 Tax=Kitasatospora sp. NPDC088346 TaxID=3364073 RepID=UPI0038252477
MTNRLRPGVTLAALTLTLCGSALATAPPSDAFGTIIGGGQNAEHEKITRRALRCTGSGGHSDSANSCFEARSLDQLAGHTGTFGAVGAPDITEVTVAAAHCDNADYRPSTTFARYPRSRAQATAVLVDCIDHLKNRYDQGVSAGGNLVGPAPLYRSDAAEYDLRHDCNFALVSSREKCDALEGFGRALHGIQDFYSHSNWADRERTAVPVSTTNPVGLNRSTTAPFLNMRATTVDTSTIPHELSTGCFELVGDDECRHRVTHDTLNKDTGSISVTSGHVGSGTTPRGGIRDNFRSAVDGAVAETELQWQTFRAELRSRYGTVRGNLIACVMTHDRPQDDCLPE